MLIYNMSYYETLNLMWGIPFVMSTQDYEN